MEEINYLPSQERQDKESKDNKLKNNIKKNNKIDWNNSLPEYKDINGQKNLNINNIFSSKKNSNEPILNILKLLENEITINNKTKNIKEKTIDSFPYSWIYKNTDNRNNSNYNLRTNLINNIDDNGAYINYNIQNNPINIIDCNQALNLNSKSNKSNQYYFLNFNSNNGINNQINENNYLMKNKINQSISNYNDSNRNIPPKFINNKGHINKYINNIEIILALLSNTKGSLFLQNYLVKINNKELSILFTTIFPYIGNIMCLEYGNYFIQKLIKKLNVQQRLNIYQAIDNNFLNIATDKSGTHSIQTLIDSLETPLEQFFLDKLLNKDMLLLFNNENGYHIIMKILLEKDESQRNNINLFFIANVEKIIINPYGAYCASKFIINNYNLNLRTLLIKNMQNNIKNFIFNKYSCSILLLAIKKFGINNFEFIIQEIKNNLSFLSLHPISNSFIIKIFHYLKTVNYYGLTSLIWNIYRNESLIKIIHSHKNGNKLLKQLMELCNNNQKKYIKAKLSFFKNKYN